MLLILYIDGLVNCLKEKGVDRGGLRLADGSYIFIMLYADDVLLVGTSELGLQSMLWEMEEFFDTMGLNINPGKSEIVLFGKPEPLVNITLSGTEKNLVKKAKYLGIVFESDRGWENQIGEVMLSSKLAVGRCKIIAKTIGLTNVKRQLELYDSIVSSILPYSAGVWAIGSKESNLAKFDDIFVDFLRSMFHLPCSVLKKSLFLNLGRRCCFCDTLFLAACQIARGKLKDSICLVPLKGLKLVAIAGLTLFN